MHFSVIAFVFVLAQLLLAEVTAVGDEKKGIVEFGSWVPFTNGHGKVKALFHHNGDIPLKIGVQFTADLLEDYPTRPSDGQSDVYSCDQGPGTGEVAMYCCGHEILPLFPPAVQEKTAFRHISMNFNPVGHFPSGVYNVPHIDFHFWTQTSEERTSIPGVQCMKDMCLTHTGLEVAMNCSDAYALAKDVPADELPPGYANVIGVEPRMSNHLAPVAFADEFKPGGRFLHTFIFPSCYGHICAFEPMVTLEFFQKTVFVQKKVCFRIRTPQALPKAGYYPTKYCMSYNDVTDTYRVYLTAFKLFPASDGILDECQKM